MYMEYRTNDFYSSVVLKLSGKPLKNFQREHGKFVVFIFDASPEECEAILVQYWDRKLPPVQIRDVVEMISEMKTRLYQVNGG